MSQEAEEGSIKIKTKTKTEKKRVYKKEKDRKIIRNIKTGKNEGKIYF